MSTVKIGLIVLLAAMSTGEAASANGMSSCKCLGSKKKFMCGKSAPPCITELKCAHSWAVGGKCVNITSPSVIFKEYPYDYGDSCKKHHEVGSPKCYNQSPDPPTELAGDKKEGWCDDPWCFVDCCACDASDAEYSHWFKPVKIPYSYSTCGASDKFTGLQDVETGKCEVNGCGGASTEGSSTGATKSTTAEAAAGLAADGAQMVANFNAFVAPIAALFLWVVQ
jgi:hypothetical protein